MENIIAIDLKKNKVVKAFAGLRFNYKPLKLNSRNFSDPIKFISFLNKKIFFKYIYIADLDSISLYSPNYDLIFKILKKFQKITFIIDCGFEYPISVNNFSSRLRKFGIYNFKIILGTEKIKKFSLRSFFLNRENIISLDFNGKESYWIKKIRLLKIKPVLIFMFLKNVGGRGVEWKRVSNLLKTFSQNQCFVAGGIKYFGELKKLRIMGVRGAIISTLIHRKISRDIISP